MSGQLNAQQLAQNAALSHLAELHYKDCKRCQSIVNLQIENANNLSRAMGEIYKNEQMALPSSQRDPQFRDHEKPEVRNVTLTDKGAGKDATKL